MLSFKAYLTEKKSKVLINPKKDELKEVLKKNHGEDCDCMKCEQKRRKDDVNDGPDVQNEAAPLAAVAKVAAKAVMGGVKAAAKGTKVAAKASKAAAKVGKATKGVRKTYNTAKKVANVASGVSSAMSSANSDNNSSSTTLEAKEYTGPDKKDRALIKKMDNPSYAKKLADYEKNMDPKKRQALKDKATKGMKFTHEETTNEAKKCWPGYEKKGTQKLFGKTYNRCVKKEDLEYVREKAAAWTRKAGKNQSGGLNEKGRKSYERENPGSDLKAPSKKVGNPRRASFCARMKGMKKKLTSSKTANDPDSRINKSLRKWNC